MDLNKLTAALWYVTTHDLGTEFTVCAKGNGQVARVVSFNRDNDAEFIALARNAFEVMMRRGWMPVKCPNGWCAAEPLGINTWAWAGFGIPCPIPISPSVDPFTCLVEADKWCRENVEKKP